MKNLTTGQLAKATGVHVETIRYYERRGLIPIPSRRASGYRVFTQDYVGRIRFIKRAQALGFTLKEISELLALSDGNPVCEDIRKFTEEKIKDIETRIHDLTRIKEVLQDLVNQCMGKKKFSGCPIIKSLNKHGNQE